MTSRRIPGSRPSITAPNFLHREIGVAMASAGKHIWLEKPVGLTTNDANTVRDAVKAAGVQGAVGFNYRNARRGRRPRHDRRWRVGVDHACALPVVQRLRRASGGSACRRFERGRGGSGVLGDLASHGVDLAWYLLGDIDSLVADTAIFVTERARTIDATSGHARAAGGEPGPVENEDYVAGLLRFTSRTRHAGGEPVAVSEQNNYGFEIHGTRGALFWDFRRLGELGVSQGTAYQDQPVSTLYVGPGAGAYAAFQPGAAISMGYDDLKVIEAYNFLRSIAGGKAVRHDAR